MFNYAIYAMRRHAPIYLPSALQRYMLFVYAFDKMIYLPPHMNAHLIYQSQQ